MAKLTIVFEKLTVEDQEKVRAGELAPTLDLCSVPRPNPATCQDK